MSRVRVQAEGLVRKHHALWCIPERKSVSPRSVGERPAVLGAGFYGPSRGVSYFLLCSLPVLSPAAHNETPYTIGQGTPRIRVVWIAGHGFFQNDLCLLKALLC